MSSLVGKTLGKYYIVKHLGSGGMAEVYQAYQAGLSRYVAVKVVHSHLAQDLDFIERFEREALALAQLRHPNIVSIFDFDLADEIYYMLMEYIDGPTLKDELAERHQKKDPFSLSETAQIFTALAAAIDYAHRRGVIHRDLKPANVMFTAEGHIVLTDFGIAHLVEATGHSLSGAVSGTPAYMSPEQAQGELTTPYSDIYSLGVMLYEVIVGQRPFDADSQVYLLMKHITEMPPAPSSVNPDIPPDVEAIIMRALDKQPEQRFATAREMILALRQAIGLSAEELLAAIPAAATPIVALRTPPAGIPLDKQATPELGPPEPLRPPAISDFVGRQAELSYFAQKLAEDRMAVISGMAGVGKTSLAATLAEIWQVWQMGQPRETVSNMALAEIENLLNKEEEAHRRVFWHSFNPGEGLMSLLWKLAGFLAWHGQVDLWQMLGTSQKTGSEPPPPETLLDYLFQLLQGQTYLLCLDDFQYIEDDPLLASFTSRLERAVQENQLSFIITTRHIPQFVLGEAIESLSGLKLEDVARLIKERGLTLNAEQTGYLYTHTEGNAELLVLAINALNRTKRPDRILKRLAESDDIERYLISQVDSTLNEDEREVMEAVAVLLGYPGTRDVIETVMDGGGIRRLLRDLTDRYLLLLDKRDLDRAYLEHSMVQTFYYDSLSRRQRKVMHHLAGEYYQTEEPDILKAALHYYHAGDYERSAELATLDVWALINKGAGRRVKQLLDNLKPSALTEDLQIKVNLAQGDLSTLLGEPESGQRAYQKGLDILQTQPVSATNRELKAKIYRGLADLFRSRSPAEAKTYLEKGLLEVAGQKSLEEAALHLKLGTLQIQLGEYQKALNNIQRGTALFTNPPDWFQAAAMLNSSIIYQELGDVPQSIETALAALSLNEKLSDYVQLLKTLNTLGNSYALSGDVTNAIATYDRALNLAKRLGHINAQLLLALNVGVLQMRHGNNKQARAGFADGLHLAQSKGLPRFEIYFQTALAGVYLHEADYKKAHQALTEAENLTKRLKQRRDLPEIYRLYALYYLATTDLTAASEWAEQSVALGRELGQASEAGASLRVLAQIEMAQGQTETARQGFTHSFDLLQEIDPYEAALTQLEWGRSLLTGPDAERGKTLVEEARATFERLGAKRDLAEAERLLGDE